MSGPGAVPRASVAESALARGVPPRFARLLGAVPIVVGLVVAAATLLLWRALVLRERVQLHEQVRLAAQSSERLFERQVVGVEQALRRARDQTPLQSPSPTWRQRVGAMVRDVEGLERMLRLAPDGTVRDAAPLSESSGARDEARLLLADRADWPVQAPSVRYFRGDRDDMLFAVLARCDDAPCPDALAGALSMRELIRPLLQDTARGFHLALQRGPVVLARTADRQPNDAGLVVRVPVMLGSVRYELAVWPTAALLARSASALPLLVLLLGLSVAVLLGLTVHHGLREGSAAAARERARLNRALERATDGIWDWDVPTGSVVRSPALWRHLGYDTATLSPRADVWTALIHPDDLPRVESALAEHLAGRLEAYEAEYRLQARNGEWRTIVDRGRAVLRTPDGAALRMLGISADISEQRRTEEQIRELESLSTMGRLAARVAHEINNPLAGIQNAFLLIKDAVPPTHPHARYVGAIEREISRIAGITRQLYETYRPETEVNRDASVHTVVGDAVALLEQVNRSRRVKLEVAVGPVPVVIPVPDAVLRQCAFNLIQNAIEAAPDDTVVRIDGLIERDSFVLRVRDAGPGIPDALRARVLEPFFTTKHASIATGGMGLGLALVHRSVRALGGHIDITSPVGGGTEVAVRLPLRTQFHS